ncbi:MAG: hypothetical protein WD021_09610 [Rhodothermales bacterium]
MTDQATDSAPRGPAALASSLVDTLQEEYDSLVRLRGHFDAHILALRQREKSGITDATHETNDEISRLAGLKHQRDRKLRLLGRVLRVEGDPATIEDVTQILSGSEETAEDARSIERLRTNIRREAERTQRRCRDLEFALEYAVLLGRDLLQVLQGMAPTGATKVYTPKGGAVESSGSAAFVNRIG